MFMLTDTQSTELLKRGSLRSDGYRFWAYEKRGGQLREHWRSPEAYARRVERTRELCRNWCKLNRKVADGRPQKGSGSGMENHKF